MSGHSKWSTIKRQKGAADQKRGAAFTKLANAITIAVREGGGGDPNFNFRLRLAIEKAREANMPKDNIQRSIDRGLGKGEGVTLENAVYEGFGPGGVAVIVETITDNKTRTGSVLRLLFDRAGGNLGATGAVSYLFTRMGEIEVDKTDLTDEELLEKALNADAVDTEDNLVYTHPEDLHEVKVKLEEDGVKVVSAQLVYRPNKETLIVVSEPEKLQTIHSFLEQVSDLDDVQEVYANLS